MIGDKSDEQVAGSAALEGVNNQVVIDVVVRILGSRALTDEEADAARRAGLAALRDWCATAVPRCKVADERLDDGMNVAVDGRSPTRVVVICG